MLRKEKIESRAKTFCLQTIKELKLKDLKESKLLSFKIVGEDEADAKLEKISFLSPLARTLIGKYPGDDIKVEIPSGSKRYKIISVEYI